MFQLFFSLNSSAETNVRRHPWGNLIPRPLAFYRLHMQERIRSSEDIGIHLIYLRFNLCLGAAFLTGWAVILDEYGGNPLAPALQILSHSFIYHGLS